MKRIVWGMIILLGACAAASPVWGAAPRARGMCYFSLGWDRIDRDEFQTRLDRTGLGYPLQPRDHLALGGGALFCSRRLVIGAEGLALLSTDRAGGGFQTSLTGALGVFQIGYVLINSERWTVYPLLGFGASSLTWKIQRDEAPESFEDVIRQPELGSSLLNASFLLQAALGADYWIKLHPPAERGTSCLVVGLRLGYTYAASGTHWELQMYDRTLQLSGAPELGITGPFLRLVVGWGGVGRSRL